MNTKYENEKLCMAGVCAALHADGNGRTSDKSGRGCCILYYQNERRGTWRWRKTFPNVGRNGVFRVGANFAYLPSFTNTWGGLKDRTFTVGLSLGYRL